MLVTNLRQFVLVGEDSGGRPARLETFQLAESAEVFWQALEKPQALARTAGAGLGEYLARALSHRAALAEPRDLAWLLASYARDGLARVEAAGDAPQLAVVRSALEEALGVRFEGDKGARFFRSTLVQTLFYGVFSAWVLWARTETVRTADDGPLFANQPGGFDWRTAVWHLRAPGLGGPLLATGPAGPPPTPGPGGSAGLDRRRTGTGGPRRLLLPLQHRRGGALLL